MDIDRLLQTIPKITRSWTEDDVRLWLHLINLSHLAPIFKYHQIDGARLLNINYHFLQEIMKLKSKIIKKKLLNWIYYLCQMQDMAYLKLIDKSQKKEQNHLFRNVVNGSEITNKKQFSSQCFEYQDCSDNKSQTTTKRNITFPKLRQSQYQSNHQSLYVYERPISQNKFIICEGKTLTFGKSILNHFVIFLTDILPFHCEIIHQNNLHFLTFHQQNASVWKNIKGKIKLQDQQVFQMGESLFFVDIDGPMLKIGLLNFYNTRQNFMFQGQQTDKIRIGRKILCEISVPYDRTMSALHGKFSFQERFWYFQDFQTTNGTWIKCKEKQLIIDKFIFRLGKNSNTFECRIQDNKDCPSQASSNVSYERCKECKNNEKNSYYRPCSHHCSCYQCGLRNSHCQICSQEISQVVKIYK